MTDRISSSSSDRLSFSGGVGRPPRAGETRRVLSNEMLAAYIEGHLSPDERRAVEAVLAADPDSYAWLVDAVALARELPPDEPTALPDVRHEPIRRRWPLAMAALATAALLALLLRGAVTLPSSPEQHLAALVVEAGTPAIEPWLSGGFQVSGRPTMRGGGDGRPSTALLARVVDLERAAVRTPSPAVDHALGVALLVAGGAGRAEAIVRLQAAAAADPRPAYLSDLAAAYLERAIRTGAASDAEQALPLTTRALAVAPRLPEALYNRALALQTLNRLEDANAAWAAFLAVPEGPGHPPAREHLARLRQRLGAGATP